MEQPHSPYVRKGQARFSVQVNSLLPAHGLQILPEEVEHFDETNTVTLKNGNYLFIMGLYHNLHCLVRNIQLVASASNALTLVIIATYSSDTAGRLLLSQHDGGAATARSGAYR